MAFKELNQVTTIGELRAAIAPYDNEVSFGFLNQPMQQLLEVRFDFDTTVPYVAFVEPSAENTHSDNNKDPLIKHLYRCLEQQKAAIEMLQKVIEEKTKTTLLQ